MSFQELYSKSIDAMHELDKMRPGFVARSHLYMYNFMLCYFAFVGLSMVGGVLYSIKQDLYGYGITGILIIFMYVRLIRRVVNRCFQQRSFWKETLKYRKRRN